MSEVEVYEDNHKGYKNFVKVFVERNPSPITMDSDLPLRMLYDCIKEGEIKGEIMDWTMIYLSQL